MAQDLSLWYRRCSNSAATPKIRVRPFLNKLPPRAEFESTFADVKWDFVYVADGVAHKNHLNLLEAWCILARKNIRPRLALTLGTSDELLLKKILDLRSEYRLEISNLGELPHDSVISLYKACRFLIFPSLSESFGLPLIEANHFGLPIIASELDYVRDVCSPIETFNPNSSKSIALAVMRALKINDIELLFASPSDFLVELIPN
jgi:glycosyltransferase involved in cell wall biosynthesis